MVASGDVGQVEGPAIFVGHTFGRMGLFSKENGHNAVEGEVKEAGPGLIEIASGEYLPGPHRGRSDRVAGWEQPISTSCDLQESQLLPTPQKLGTETPLCQKQTSE